MLIANSEYTARKSRTRYPDLPEIKVCWPGKDLAATRNSSDIASLENVGPHAMLIVGRLSAEQKHKGHDHLLEAMPAIVQTVPDAQLVVAGGGDDRERLESRAQDLGLDRHIVFTGWADEALLQRLYAQCALFVMPSDGDGFGLVFLEAMAHRKPCVGLEGGAAAEIFEDGESGFLVDREDRQGMADRLSGLLLDEAERMRLGDAAYERFQSQFTARHYSGRLRSVLLEYLENKYAT